jgi:RNA polymerase sigma-70 factor, ECF subfamily
MALVFSYSSRLIKISAPAGWPSLGRIPGWSRSPSGATRFSPGNKANPHPLSSCQASWGELPLSGRAVSIGFNDQLIAVLPRLRRFARGLTGSAVEADDLVQAACERALSRAHQFQEGTRFDSWMFRIVQTIWIDQLRARDVRREDAEDQGAHIGTDEPKRRAEARLALDEVRNALSEIPAEQRAALLLVTVDGLSYKEAAEVADVPVGTIMSRLARARIALQAKLDAGAGLRRSTSDVKAE